MIRDTYDKGWTGDCYGNNYHEDTLVKNLLGSFKFACTHTVRDLSCHEQDDLDGNV